jgi:hypothetical protein
VTKLQRESLNGIGEISTEDQRTRKFLDTLKLPKECFSISITLLLARPVFASFLQFLAIFLMFLADFQRFSSSFHSYFLILSQVSPISSEFSINFV